MSTFFASSAEVGGMLDQPLDPDLVAELDDELLHTALLDASAADSQALWAEVERRGLDA